MEVKLEISRSERGQSMLEFSVSAIVILTLLVGVADFGRAFFTYLTMRDAAQEGAVFGSFCPLHSTDIESRVRESAERPVDLGDTQHVSVICQYIYDVNGDGYIDAADNYPDCGTMTPVPGQGIKVRVIYDNFQITTPLLGSILGTQSLTLRTEVQDTILRIPNIPPPGSCPEMNE
jgi:hypothetical protein